MNYNLKVINFSEDEVIFEDEDKKIIYWPKNKLPQIPEIGETVYFNIDNKKIDNKKVEIQPRDLLNELLNIQKE